MSALRDGLLFGIGNPLLDISVQADEELLEKYHLEPNNAIIGDDSHLPLYKEITENLEPVYTAGGSAQNSLRVCQWLLKRPKTCVYMGSVGSDYFSEILKQKAEEDGVIVKYQYQKETPTGTCAVIVTQDQVSNRSLCANLAAANCFTKDHITDPENMKYIDGADYIYIGGFFLTVSPETIMTLAEIAHTKQKTLMTNLSAPFICNLFTKPLMDLMPYVNVLFGNETEADTLAESLKFGISDLKEIALRLSKLPNKSSTSRLVIITQGRLPVIIAKDDVITEVSVPNIPLENIVDTNGAGDAFVGGFLSKYVHQRPVEECVKCGIWAAGHIIQHSGCTFDYNVSYDD